MDKLVLTTWNIGNGTTDDALQLLSSCHVLALQEAGDRAEMLMKLRRKGYKVISPKRKGASSTPLVYNPRVLELVKPRTYLVSKSQYAGPGAGPDRVKTKYIVGGLFKDKRTGKKFNAFSTHYVASSYQPLREKIAIAASRVIVRVTSPFKRPTFVLGDFNATPGDNVLRPLARASWTNNHIRGDELRTHGKRSIDYVWWIRAKGVRFLGHRIIKNRSDHNAVEVGFELL